MRRRAEHLLTVAVVAGFLAAAVAVSLLIDSASRRGIDALEASVQTEVDSLARSMASRIGLQQAGVGGALLGFDFEVEVGSERDRETLEELEELLGPALPAGAYLVDLDGTVTDGIFIDEDLVGRPAPVDGIVEAMRRPSFEIGVGQVLPVGEGLTTAQPAQVQVLPVLSGPVGQGGRPIGALVSEVPVHPESDLNQEIRALHRGETGRYHLADEAGTVLAATDPGAVAGPLPEPVAGRGPGLHRSGGQIVVVSALEDLGWTIALTQDVDEFEEPLARPLQLVGTVLVLVLLAGGMVLSMVLIRRLRAARREQARLAEIGAAQQELISIVSHELRTPVAGVLGFLETSLDHWEAMDDEQRRSAVRRAAANARRLQAMARDVLDTQALETGEVVAVTRPVDLVAEVRDAVAAQQEVDRDRTFELDVPDEALWVQADADRVQQVLANLLDNARKNSPAVSPVRIAVRAVDGQVEVAVSDEGPGVPPEARDRVFEKFVRGRSETVTGTGLGLYISRRLVEAHGGRIWIADGGEGTTFCFSLPRTPVPAGDQTS